MIMLPQVQWTEEDRSLGEVRSASRMMPWTSLKVPKRPVHPRKPGMTCLSISAKKCRIWRKTRRLVLLTFRLSLRTPCSSTRLRLSLLSSTSTKQAKSILSLTQSCLKILMNTLTATCSTTSFRQIFSQLGPRCRKLTKLTTMRSLEMIQRMMRMTMSRATSRKRYNWKIQSKRTWWRWRILAKHNSNKEPLSKRNCQRPQGTDRSQREGRPVLSTRTPKLPTLRASFAFTRSTKRAAWKRWARQTLAWIIGSWTPKMETWHWRGPQIRRCFPWSTSTSMTPTTNSSSCKLGRSIWKNGCLTPDH